MHLIELAPGRERMEEGGGGRREGGRGGGGKRCEERRGPISEVSCKPATASPAQLTRRPKGHKGEWGKANERWRRKAEDLTQGNLWDENHESTWKMWKRRMH